MEKEIIKQGLKIADYTQNERVQEAGKSLIFSNRRMCMRPLVMGQLLQSVIQRIRKNSSMMNKDRNTPDTARPEGKTSEVFGVRALET